MINRFLLGLGALLLGILVVTHVSAAGTEPPLSDILCPDVDTSKKETPTDVAGVQADIERLNLCVERATLLKQLDDISQQRSDILNKVNNPTFAGGMGVNVIPTLPGGAFPALPESKSLEPGQVKIRPAGDNPMGSMGSGIVATAPATKGSANWKIRKIWGQAGGVGGASMRAQLSDGQGALLNVVKGDPLPDGQVVESVSIRGVTLSQSSSKGSGKINDLSWEETTDSAAATAAAPATAEPITP